MNVLNAARRFAEIGSLIHMAMVMISGLLCLALIYLTFRSLTHIDTLTRSHSETRAVAASFNSMEVVSVIGVITFTSYSSRETLNLLQIRKLDARTDWQFRSVDMPHPARPSFSLWLWRGWRWQHDSYSLFAPMGNFTSTWTISAPTWPLILLTGGFPLFELRYPLRRRRRARNGLCRHCGYDLRASNSICPECGQVQDPSTQR